MGMKMEGEEAEEMTWLERKRIEWAEDDGSDAGRGLGCLATALTLVGAFVALSFLFDLLLP